MVNSEFSDGGGTGKPGINIRTSEKHISIFRIVTTTVSMITKQ